MAKECSFDVVSKIDMQEVKNAVNQTNKEISQRYDFRDSKAEVVLEEDTVKILADSDFQLKSVIDILQSKLIRRKVAVKNLEYGKVESASGGMVKQNISIKQGIDDKTAKKIVKDIKSLKLKVQAKIMEDQIRVSGKKKDDLQKVIQFLKENDYGLELQFVNFRG
ncbi:YajQ family cyclic di-GMP-binding protein [Peptococcaceae bacterium]|nr:YajQ family cyclic di-GMP-binding protein [Peptococcaceae bacterium]MCL0101273.1 YajQ family cyclic di-GMP-binding protein [Peptococcaceae bacterium]